MAVSMVELYLQSFETAWRLLHVLLLSRVLWVLSRPNDAMTATHLITLSFIVIGSSLYWITWLLSLVVCLMNEFMQSTKLCEDY